MTGDKDLKSYPPLIHLPRSSEEVPIDPESVTINGRPAKWDNREGWVERPPTSPATDEGMSYARSRQFDIDRSKREAEQISVAMATTRYRATIADVETLRNAVRRLVAIIEGEDQMHHNTGKKSS